MPHSLGEVYVHLVLSTRERVPFLVDGTLRRGLHGYMTGIFKNLGCPSLRVGGVDDHVHALFRLSRVQPIASVVQEVRKGSASWLRARGIRAFDWHDGYDAFSVSPRNLDRVIRYIANQAAVHLEQSSTEERRRLLARSGGLRHRVDVHLVFSTKNRVHHLIDAAVRKELHARLEELCEDVGCPARQVGGFEDHVHILYRLDHELPLARVAQQVKKSSSAWLAKRHRIMHFYWQEGYGAFSVSPQHVSAVIRYIKNQHEHHRHESLAVETSRVVDNQTQTVG